MTSGVPVPGRAGQASPQAPETGLGHTVTIPDAGDVFSIVYPFVRDTYERFNEEGCENVPTWKPGIRYEPLPPYGEDTGSIADGIGKVVFTVEAVFKPGRFPMRVFFTRQFVDPDGKQFGKGKLHIVTLDKFRRLARGYQHRFGIGEPLASDWNAQRARETFERMLARHIAASGMEARRAASEAAVHDSPTAEGGDAQ